MKTTLILLFTSLVCVNINAQFGSQQIITTNADEANSVYSADLDGDGDMDVLSASSGDNKIAWYENDGNGNFGQQEVIADVLGDSVYASDIDGDGDMDVVAGDNPLAWYENDGNGNFGSQQIITQFGYLFNFSKDIDGDGDLDVFSSLFQNQDIYFGWHENVNGDGSVWNEHVSYVGGVFYYYSFYAEDLDGDGDLDAIFNGSLIFPGVFSLRWRENDGDGNFGTSQLIDSGNGLTGPVYASDIDGDGDMDVLSAKILNARTIAWYENDGNGNFGSQQIITTSADEANSVYSADLDGDGDMDVLSASSGDNKIAWYENVNGNGSIWLEYIITTDALGAQSVYAEDLNGDGYMDVLSASSDDDKIAWFENLHPLGVNENTLLDFSVYPNPVKDVLNILSQNDYPISSIQIYDILGRMVLEEKDDFNQMDVSNLVSGVLFVKIRTNEEVATKK